MQQYTHATIANKIAAAKEALSFINYDRLLPVGCVRERANREDPSKPAGFFCVILREGKYIPFMWNLDKTPNRYSYTYFYTKCIYDTIEACADAIMETKEVDFGGETYKMELMYTRDETVMHLKTMLPQAKIEDILKF